MKFKKQRKIHVFIPLTEYKTKQIPVCISIIFIIAGVVLFSYHGYCTQNNSDTFDAAPSEGQNINPGEDPQGITTDTIDPITTDSCLSPDPLFPKAPGSIALVYKYKSVRLGASFTDDYKVFAFIVVESTGNGFGSSAMIIFFPEFKNYILSTPSGYGFWPGTQKMGVTYHSSAGTYHVSLVGATKSMTFKGMIQGEKFQKTVQCASSLKGASVLHAGGLVGYGKASMQLAVTKMKHIYNEGDVSLNAAIAHLERILKNKLGYTRLGGQQIVTNGATNSIQFTLPLQLQNSQSKTDQSSNLKVMD